MDLEEQKKVIEEFKQLNKQARAILKQMKQSLDFETSMALQEQFNAIKRRLDKISSNAIKILEENDKPLTDIVTPTQAQNVWNGIRDNIRLAKFGDDGVPLPDIDMRKIFKRKKYLPLAEVTKEILSIIEKWQPKL